MEKDIMLHYMNLVEFLGVVLGPNYEVVLYDLRRDDRNIIAIANGHVSGRSVGAPLTESNIKSIVNKEYEESDFRANYNSISSNNKVLRSSTLYIKNGDGKIIGLLCLNFDDSAFRDLNDKLMGLIHPDELIHENSFEVLENIRFSDESDSIGTTMEEVSENAIRRVLKNSSVPLDRLTKEEKLNIVKILDDKGIFMLKGAVSYVAELLHSSEATIYRYLNDINSGK
ncbi:MAG: PAS domain-containing protein [Tissierellaceae bacterium]|nr:PAS domain-containing protein [Tissierellaceae bacterium]